MSGADAPDAVLFDLDGVLVDSELHWRPFEGHFLRALVPTWSDADQAQLSGLSLDGTFALLARAYGVEASRAELQRRYDAMAARIYTEQVALLPGARPLLDALGARGVPLAIVSSSPQPPVIRARRDDRATEATRPASSSDICSFK